MSLVFFLVILVFVLGAVAGGINLLLILVLVASLYLWYKNSRKYRRSSKSVNALVPIEGIPDDTSESSDGSDGSDGSQSSDGSNGSDGSQSSDGSDGSSVGVYSPDVRIPFVKLGMNLCSEGSLGDNQLCHRMKYAGAQAKTSQDIRKNWNTHTFLPYYEEELKENESKHWYGNGTYNTVLD